MQQTIRHALLAALSSVALLTTLGAQAAAPSQQSLQQLAKLSHIDQMFSETLKNGGVDKQALQNMIRNGLARSGKGFTDLSQEKRDHIVQLVEQFQQKMIDSINTPETRQKVVDTFMQIAGKSYSQEEVKAMIDFYQTPTGQSILKKQPQVARAVLSQLMPIFMQKQMSIAQKEAPALQKQIKEIIGEDKAGEVNVK